MKNNKKQFTIFLFVMAICFMSLKLNLESTQLGHYRPAGYNFLGIIDEEQILDRDLLLANMPVALNSAYQAQGVNFSTVQIDTAEIKLWGPVMDPDDAPADRVYNVVFHPDVQRWRSSDGDFNTNLLAGLFAPNGVVQAAKGEAIPFNTFGMVNVNKHDRIYYSPDNARFQLEPGRRIITFWTAVLSEDKTKTAIAFNIIVDEQALSEEIGAIVSDSENSDDDNDDEMIAQIVALVDANGAISAADKQAMHDAIALMQRIKGIPDQDQEDLERAARAQQEEADRQMAERLTQEMARAEAQQRADQAAAQLAAQQAEQERIRAEALRVQQEQDRIRREQEAARLAEELRTQQEAQQRIDQAAAQLAAQQEADRQAAQQARIQAEAAQLAQQEQERVRREQQEAADRALRLQQQQAAPAVPQVGGPQQQRTGQQGLSREERIAREQAAEQEAMDKLLKRKK